MTPELGSNPRAVALSILRRVIEQGGYSNLVLAAALERGGLSAADRRLTTELAYGTIRRLLRLDRALAPLADRPLAEASPQALALLRLGAYQLLFTRIPAHAAVSETVSLAAAREKGFVNAVLRRVAVERPEPPDGESDADVAARTGLAQWAVRELHLLLGGEAEQAATTLATPAPLSLRTNTCRASVEELEAALAGEGVATSRGALIPSTLMVGPSAPAGLPGFREGWFAVQDQASAFVVHALDPGPGERVLDACAAPGGKACHIACRVGESGIAVAGDISAARARLIGETARRLGVRVRVLAQDGRRPAVREAFDKVLVDAPCSGIGAARRRPELLWRPRREDLSGLARLQVAITAASADVLRPGGRLVYSVCTFPRAETDAACDAILRKRPDLEPLTIDGPDGPAARIRLWPHRHGADAMFVAAFRKKE